MNRLIDHYWQLCEDSFPIVAPCLLGFGAALMLIHLAYAVAK